MTFCYAISYGSVGTVCKKEKGAFLDIFRKTPLFGLIQIDQTLVNAMAVFFEQDCLNPALIKRNCRFCGPADDRIGITKIPHREQAVQQQCRSDSLAPFALKYANWAKKVFGR